MRADEGYGGGRGGSRDDRGSGGGGFREERGSDRGALSAALCFQVLSSQVVVNTYGMATL